MNKTKKQLTNELVKAHQQIDELEKVEWVAKEWRNLFDSITDYVSLHDKDFRIVRVNKALADYVGVTPKELIGKHCYKIFHGTEEPVPDCPHVETMKFKKTVTKEFYEPKFNSHIMVVTSPIVDERGDPKGSVHIVKNISDRKKKEESLRLTQFTVDHAADAIFWMGPDAKFFYVNDKACHSLGYSREELLSMTVHDIDPNFPPEAWPEHWEHVKRRGSFTVESNHRTKDGKIFPVEITINYLEFNGKEYNCAFAHNVTERREAEDALQQSEERLRTLIQSIRTGVVVHAADTSIIQSNVMAQKLLGLTEDQMLGKKAIDQRWRFFREDGNDMPLEEYPVNQVIASQKILEDLVIGVYHPEMDNVVWLLVNAVPVFDQESDLARVIVTFVDITERKQAEEERERLIRELREALVKVKTLSGLIPICSYCHKIRDDKGYWTQVADYISKHSEAEFSHGFCPECAENFKKKYPEYFKKKDN